MTDDESPQVSVVPYLRSVPGVAHSEEVQARCFLLWATTAARNASAVERLIGEELRDTDIPVPTRVVIAVWSRTDNWAAQADTMWSETKDWTRQQLQALVLANVVLGHQRRHEVLQGQYEGRNDLAAQYLKAGELSDKFVEKVLPLTAMRPPEKETVGEEEMSKEEREALARTRIVRKKEESA